MKRIVALLLALLLCATVGTGMAAGFDTKVFEDNSWKVTIDDMEQRGFIENREIMSADMSYQPEYIYSDNMIGGDCRRIRVTPDVYLGKYGTSKFVPYPRIWLDMHSKYNIYGWTMVQSVIIKVGDVTCTFEGNTFGNTTDTKSWYYGSGWTTEKMVCVCTDTEFMDAWIESTGPVKVRLKGSKGQVDFNLPSGSVREIKEMFQCFRDAGGYAYFNGISY